MANAYYHQEWLKQCEERRQKEKQENEQKKSAEEKTEVLHQEVPPDKSTSRRLVD